MSSQVPLHILVELARKAEKKEYKKPSKEAKYSSVEDFIFKTNLQAGRNKETLTAIYEAYLLWADNPMDKIMFTNQLKKFIKTTNGFKKINMKLITLTEKIKELKNEKEKK